MLIGQFEHNLDVKKRLSIPAKWRSIFGEKVIVTSGLDKSLFIFSELEWSKIASSISEKGFMDMDTRNFSRLILSNAFDLSIDSHGRVLLPEYLINYAGLKTDIVLAGNYNRAEIWDKEEFSKLMESVNKNADDIASRMSKLI
jgi:MraZ protein